LFLPQVSVAPHFLAPGSFVHTQFKKWREMTTKQDKEIEDLKTKHKSQCAEIFRDVKKTIQDNEVKKRDEER
jgi:hypothetical protein